MTRPSPFSTRCSLQSAGLRGQLDAGIVLDLQGDFGKARGYLEQAVELRRRTAQVQALRTMAVSYAFHCDLPQVATYEQHAFDSQVKDQKFTDAAGTANELARIYLECGDVREASKWYRPVTTPPFVTQPVRGRSRPVATSAGKTPRLAWPLAKASQAGRRRRRRCQGDPRQGQDSRQQQRFYPYLTGYVAFYAGNYKSAIEELQKADQKDPFILVLLAQAYEKTGNQSEAMKYYRQVLAINSHNPYQRLRTAAGKEEGKDRE